MNKRVTPREWFYVWLVGSQIFIFVLPVSHARLFDILGVVDALIQSVHSERMCLFVAISS